jgi:acetolactate synthase-1/3 small subunit
MNKTNIHTLSFLVANKPGVLVRVAQVFARRAFNIDSLVVSSSFDPKFSRMTITALGDVATLDQIIKQCGKLIDVLHVSEHTGVDAVTREMSLVKIKSTKASKAAISKLLKKYDAKIVDDTKNALIIEQTGTTTQLDELESLLKKYGLVEMVRSGKMVMAVGQEPT